MCIRDRLYEEPRMLSPVLGDINRLRQVFVNILDNALKYTDEGGTISVVASEENGYIRVAISDNGCGIPPEHLPNVKKKFYKANQTVRGLALIHIWVQISEQDCTQLLNQDNVMLGVYTGNGAGNNNSIKITIEDFT